MEKNQDLSPPFLRIVRGEPSVDEIAAMVTVLTATAGARKATAPPPAVGWSARSKFVRAPLRAGHGGWRASALPQ